MLPTAFKVILNPYFLISLDAVNFCIEIFVKNVPEEYAYKPNARLSSIGSVSHFKFDHQNMNMKVQWHVRT